MRKEKFNTRHEDKKNAGDRKRDRNGWKAERDAKRRAKGQRRHFERGE